MAKERRSRIEELREIEWLGHPVRRSITEHLIACGEDGATISEISSTTGAMPSLCAYHLGLMEGKGLVQNRLSRIEGRRGFSFYITTRYCIDLLVLEENLNKEVKGPDDHPLPTRMILVSWSNLPRCFLHRGITK